MQVVDYEPTFDQPALDSSLNQHLSLGLSPDLNNAVDELWQDIHRSSLDRKDILGDMTLEDFLVTSGVVAESSALKINPGSIIWLILHNEISGMNFRFLRCMHNCNKACCCFCA
ncbi:unnamed protein product [Fraxinus pennsylvanica]|uniref:Uncharacterized protein n=1 Tax=Fraxinus pennsylvanica TaxID=56036 RepID=A0AAD2AH30_9LAMI|nr:unnamed protein product [Fraxinus pennsylvanica]